MVNNVVFSTGGGWDSTTLHNNGQEVSAAQMFVELRTNSDDWDGPDGGIRNGGEMTAFIRPQHDPNDQIGIFPGRLEMNFPDHAVIVENTHPGFAYEYTRVIHDGRDVTDNVMELYVDINAVDNIVEAHVTLFKPRWLGSDEVATYRLI